MVALAAVLWTVVVAQAVPAQSVAPPPATGLIVGRVVDGTSGRPIGSAIVSLQGGAIAPMARTQPRALTNANGQFVFRKLPKGSYRMMATHSGYVDASYGQRRPGSSSRPLQLDEGQRAGDVVIAMWKYAGITGSVVDEAGEPAIGANVRAYQRRMIAGRPRAIQAGSSNTDDRGIYRMTGLVPGTYFVAFVWHETSVPTSVAELFRNGLSANDPKFSDIMRARITMGGSLSSPGSPSAVQVGGQSRDLPPNAPVPPVGQEDAALYIYPTQFYPGVPTAARARAITLGSGEARDNVDFALRPVRTSRISGTVMGLDGPTVNTPVRLVPAQDEGLTELDTSTTMTGPGGDFTLLGVPAGQYVIKVMKGPSAFNTSPPATITQISVGSSTVMSSSSGIPGNGTRPPVPDDPTEAGEAAVAVADADVGNILVTLQRGPRVTGRFEFDGTRDRPDATAMTRIFVTLDTTDGSRLGGPLIPPPEGHGDETGNFKTYGVSPGRYVFRVFGMPAGWTLRSIVSDGKDFADAAVDLRAADLSNVTITFTDRPSKLTGSVHSPDGTPDTGAFVVVFPADPAAWADIGGSPRRFRGIRADQNGAYTLNGLPSGDYYAVAIHEESTPEWQDPQVLEDLARSASLVRIAEGETSARDLKSPGGGR